MMMKKTIHLFIALLFVGSLMPLVPSAMAQDGSDASVSDSSGDVVVMARAADGDPTHTDINGPEQVADPVDLTEVRFFGESPTEINIGFSVESFSRANIQTIGKLDYFVCFQWDGTGDWYQYRASFLYSAGGSPSGEATPTFSTGYLDRMNEGCSPYSALGDPVFKYRFPTQLIQTEVDIEGGTVDVRIPRIAFENAVADGEEDGSGPVPSEGDTISGLQAVAVGRQGSNYYLLYDDAGEATTTLSTDTGNDIIRVKVPQNIQSRTVRSSGGVPVYGVEVGSFQTVPVTIENEMDEAIEANISVAVVGDAADWDVRVIKSIPVGAARDVTVDGEPKKVPGSETVTLIVNSAPEIKHKETLRLMITATDAKFPGVLGAALVDVVAVEPPSAAKKSVFFHAMGHPCNNSERWLNTLKTDPATDQNNEIEIRECLTGDEEVNNVGAGGGSVRFSPDVPFARNYVYDTTSGTEATIALKSIERVPMNPDQEHHVPVTANVLVQVLAGSQLMGEGQVDAVPIDGAAKQVKVPLTFVGTSPGATERRVSADDPLGIRIVVTPSERTFIVCNSDCPIGETERNVPASPSGRIFLLTDQSQVDLPIKSSERAGAQLNITASGALITLRLSELDAPTLVFTNPGRVVVYNLSVRNEGVNVDTAKISAKVNQTGWNVEVLPREKYKLGIGEARLFNVRVTAPVDASEGETAGITIVATSDVDEEAVASQPLTVKVTKGQQFEDQEIDEKLQDTEIEESPSGILLPGLLLVGLAFVAGRRRRF